MSSLLSRAPTPASAGLPVEPRWLTDVRLRTARHVRWVRHAWQEERYDGEQLLAISHSEVDRALRPAGEAARAERRFHRADPEAAAMTAQLHALDAQPEDPRLAHVVRHLQLPDGELALFKLTLAAAARPALSRVFGYLLDLTDAADPTPALAAALFGLPEPPALRPDAPLVRWLAAEPAALPGAPDPFGPAAGWRADGLLAQALTAAAATANALAEPPDWSAGTSGRSVTAPADPVLRPEAVDEIAGFMAGLRSEGGAGPPVEIELIGPAGSGRTALAAHAAQRLGLALIAVDARALAAGSDPPRAAILEQRRALLEDAVIAWEDADALAVDPSQTLPAAPVTFLTAAAPLTAPSRPGCVRRTVTCRALTRAERIALWSSLSVRPAPPAVAEWALRPGEIRAAVAAAPAGNLEVAEVCRRLLTASRPDLLTPLPLPFGWEDLVLAPATVGHLRELEAETRDRGEVLDEWGFARLTPLGRGTSALFSGASGTGKTMAAQVLARSLGLDLYRVDLAGVVNKYIGETEKHLRQVFDLCERAPAMLLFDEADALFGKRSQVSDAHDRYANIEIDYLLARMEQFDGVAVLTTNRQSDLDTAFVRRLRFVIDFAPPGAPEREVLWRLALEDACDADGRPLTGNLDFTALARELELTGAGIKSAALAAAFLARSESAPIGSRHVVAAARRELQKQGIVVRPGQMELR